VHVVALAELSVGYSPRQVRLDQDHVAALVEVVDRLPPVVVDERTMTVIDGLHRLEAARRAGRSEISALFFHGDETEAMVLAVQSNVKHGKPLSRSERQAAARALLARCPECSDRWLGEICGLSHATVARLRQASGAAASGVRTGRDGRRRPVDPVPGQAAVLKVLEGDPAASARQAAGAAGVAPSTAQRLASALRGRQKPPPGTTPPVTGRGLFHESLEGPAFRSSPELAKAASWLERTAVAPEDFRAYLEGVPLGRVYEVVDECRRRSRTWAELAEALEKLARSRGRHPAG
jgi:ParB-like chromosome segregation protein Spo0J